MTGPNNNNEVAWLFIVFVGGGGFGFVADGIVLLTLIYVFDVHPLLSRIFSFGIAVALTFQLNRSWAFSSLRQQHLSSAFAAYVAVQGVGFVCNLTIYTFALLMFHLPTASLPCPCVCRGPFFNYMGSKRLVFIKKMAEHLGQPQGERTSGKAWRAWPDVLFSSNTKVDEYASRPTIRAQQYSGETRERLTRLRTSSCRQCRSKRRPPPRPQSQISKALLLRRLDLQ